jgi:hypothetical protein
MKPSFRDQALHVGDQPSAIVHKQRTTGGRNAFPGGDKTARRLGVAEERVIKVAAEKTDDGVTHGKKAWRREKRIEA